MLIIIHTVRKTKLGVRICVCLRVCIFAWVSQYAVGLQPTILAFQKI